LRRKHCCYCEELFSSDPRQKEKQITCGKPECQRQRRRHNSRLWRRKNQGYYGQRYAHYGKAWSKSHPGYLKRYRQSHPCYAETNCQKQKDRDLKRKQRQAAQNLDKQIALSQISADNMLKNSTLEIVSHLDKRIARKLNFVAFDGKIAKLVPLLDMQIALDRDCQSALCS